MRTWFKELTMTLNVLFEMLMPVVLFLAVVLLSLDYIGAFGVFTGGFSNHMIR